MKNLKIHFVAVALILVSQVGLAKEVYITTDSDILPSLNNYLNVSSNLVEENQNISLLKIKESDLQYVAKLMHEEFNRCGGYVFHDSEQEGLEVLQGTQLRKEAIDYSFEKYELTRSAEVDTLINQVEEKNLRSTIDKLSAFHNRYYASQTGVDAVNWLKDYWSGLTSSRSDVSVELYKHSWAQRSLILTIEGSSKANEVIVIGGHVDSINGYWDAAKKLAPGADDNASGIATITEVLRVLVDNNYKPERTIKFMAYSAEEVGLRGSKDIAKFFKRKEINVVGVVQYDMTLHNGSQEKIALIDDYTNKDQNEFMGKLIDTYVQVPWTYSTCGYACSDHASWTNNGFKSSFPFEAKFDDHNQRIHSETDTTEVSRGMAFHPMNFAKLGLAYIVEMDK